MGRHWSAPPPRVGPRFFRGCLTGVVLGIGIWIGLFLGAFIIGVDLIGHLRHH